MTLSMTGFASAEGQFQGWTWSWDLRAVNARGLDVRLRLPEWIDGLEPLVRKALAGRITRGSVTLGLRVAREADDGGQSLNGAALDRVLAMLAEVAHAAEGRGVALRAPSPVEILGLRGVLEQAAPEGDIAALRAALVSDLPGLIAAFNMMRAHEGAAMAKVITTQLDDVETLVAQALDAVEARREAQADALRAQLARVTDNTDAVEPERIAQELALIAVKTDMREELDRLAAHVGQARSLLAGDEPRGRKLDFLMQEFNREANTLCSKAQFQTLTRIGLDLKALIDQMREQVQNIE